jgi:hypothetical protein
MDTLVYLFSAVAWLASMVCFILIVIRMFQEGSLVVALLTIALAFCFGIGWIVALIWGWQRADTPGFRNLMTLYTVLILLSLLGVLGGHLSGIAPLPI